MSPAQAMTAPFVVEDDVDQDRLVTCVDADGRWVADEPFPAGLASELVEWLTLMIRVRRLDVEATALQRQGQLGIWSPCLGQEAAQVGSATAMSAGDYAFPTYREHGVALARGVTPVQLLQHFRGTTNCGYKPSVAGLAPYSIVLGSQVLHAVGYGMGKRLQQQDSVAVAYFGDGTISQGDVNEAFVFASVYNAPVVFFCQNNQWAISEPPARQTRIPIARRGDGFGIPNVRVDGNDVVAVHRTMKSALDRARRGDGPTLIEAYTYRMGPHTTSDDPSRYRSADQVKAWKDRDPIDRLRKLLLSKAVVSDDDLDRIAAESDAEALAARSALLATPAPAPEHMFDHVHTEPAPWLDGQRRDVARWHFLTEEAAQ